MENYYFFSKVAIQVMRISGVSLVLTLWMTFASFGKEIKGQEVLNKKITLSEKSVALKSVLSRIEQQAEVSFVYSEDFVELSHSVSIETKEETLRNVLAYLLKPRRINAHLHKNQIILSRSRETVKKTVEYGALTGRVLEATTRQPLPGAAVYVKGTTIGAATDLQGEFFLSNVPVGDQTIVATYIGYADTEKSIKVEARTVVEVNFDMSPDVRSLDVVVVTGNLEGQSRALNQQRTADNIKNVISADLIGRFPDLNTAEALQRVPGINIGRDNGEGSSVQIRGTPLNYTSIQVNGEQIPSNTLGGSRSPVLTQFPVDQLGSIEVTKSITPDQDGDAIGGVVNLLPPTASSTTPTGKVELGGGYNNLSKGVNGIGKVSYGQRYFATDDVSQGKLGVLFSGSFFRTDNGEDRTESLWEVEEFSNEQGGTFEEWLLRRHDLRALETQRTRAGAGVNVDYKFNPVNMLQFNFMYSVLEEDEIRTRTRFRVDDGNLESPTLSTDAVVRKTFRDRVVERDNFSYNLQGDFQLNNGLKIEPALFFTTSKRDEDAIRGDFEAEDVDLAISGESTNFPTITSVDPIFRLEDATIYTTFRNYRPYTRTNDNQNFVGRLNLEKDLLINNMRVMVRSGYKYRHTESQRRADWNVFDYTGDRSDLFPQFADYNAVSTDFLDGRGGFGPGFNTAAVQAFAQANLNEFERNEDDELEENINSFYNGTETTHAGFFMARIQPVNQLTILTGVRYENIAVDYDALASVEDSGGTTIQPVAGTSEYDFFLPNLQLKYSVTPLTNIRAAIVRSFARADFQDLAPISQVDVEGLEIERGNPELLPAIAWNFDLAFERYLGNIGILAVTGFYKTIDDFQFDRTVLEEISEFTGGIPQTFTVEQPDNGENAEVWGVELNIQTNLDFLPGVLSGIGIYLNYTYTGSNAFTEDRSDIRLPGQADHTGNLALTYDWKGFSARASLNYQDDLVVGLGSDEFGPGESDIIRDSRYQLDLNFSQQISPKLSVYAEFINMTNQPQLEFFGDDTRIFDAGFFSWWTRFGVSYRW